MGVDFTGNAGSSPRRALIFGAGGFVGPWLVHEFLSQGYTVACSDVLPESGFRAALASHPAFNTSDGAENATENAPRGIEPDDIEPDGMEYAQVDITDDIAVAQAVHGFVPDVIVNLAAVSSVGQSWRIPAQTVQANVVGSINVLEAAKRLGGGEREPLKVLLVGSSEEYEPSDAPLSEDSPLAANNPYGISKRGVGLFADLYQREGSVRVYRTRSFNHTGPGQAPRFVVPSWCRQVAQIEGNLEGNADEARNPDGKPAVMRVGNLTVKRDISDVRDIVRGYRMLVESDCDGEVFNFGSGVATPLTQILETVIGFSSRPIVHETDPALLRPNDQPCVCADISKARRLLGWEPQIPLEQTLQDVFRSFLG